MLVNGLAILLTIAVLSRIAGNNPLFRAAQYLFVGVSLGLAFVIAYHQVMRPAIEALVYGQNEAILRYGVPLVLGILLLPRALGDQELSWLANLPLALIFGVGSALAVTGAILGTLLPQLLDSARPAGSTIASLVGTIVLTIGTILILLSFTYTAAPESRGARMVAFSASIGHWLLMITFGVFFAGAVQTYLSALTERLLAILGFFGLAR